MYRCKICLQTAIEGSNNEPNACLGALPMRGESCNCCTVLYHKFASSRLAVVTCVQSTCCTGVPICIRWNCEAPALPSGCIWSPRSIPQRRRPPLGSRRCRDRQPVFPHLLLHSGPFRAKAVPLSILQVRLYSNSIWGIWLRLAVRTWTYATLE